MQVAFFVSRVQSGASGTRAAANMDTDVAVPNVLGTTTSPKWNSCEYVAVADPGSMQRVSLEHRWGETYAWSPDGGSIYSESNDVIVVAAESFSGKDLRGSAKAVLASNINKLNCVAMSWTPNNKHVITISRQECKWPPRAAVSLWDVTTATLLDTTDILSGEKFSIVWSPCCSRAAVSIDCDASNFSPAFLHIVLLEIMPCAYKADFLNLVATDVEKFCPNPQKICMCWADAGETLLYVLDGAIRSYAVVSTDESAKAIEFRFISNDLPITRMLASPCQEDGLVAYRSKGALDFALKFYNRQTRSLVFPLPEEVCQRSRAFAWSPDGTRFVVLGSCENYIFRLAMYAYPSFDLLAAIQCIEDCSEMTYARDFPVHWSPCGRFLICGPCLFHLVSSRAPTPLPPQESIRILHVFCHLAIQRGPDPAFFCNEFCYSRLAFNADIGQVKPVTCAPRRFDDALFPLFPPGVKSALFCLLCCTTYTPYPALASLPIELLLLIMAAIYNRFVQQRKVPKI